MNPYQVMFIFRINFRLKPHFFKINYLTFLQSVEKSLYYICYVKIEYQI